MAKGTGGSSNRWGVNVAIEKQSENSISKIVSVRFLGGVRRKEGRFRSASWYREANADREHRRSEREKKRGSVCVRIWEREREREKPGQEVDQRGVWERRRGIISEPASAIIHRPFEFSALVITTNTRQMNRGRVKERGKGGGKTARANREKKRGIAGEKEERRTAWLMESPRRARAPPG